MLEGSDEKDNVVRRKLKKCCRDKILESNEENLQGQNVGRL